MSDMIRYTYSVGSTTVAIECETVEQLLQIIERGRPDDGWIPCHGGECPVDPEEVVDVILRDGKVIEECAACVLRWSHHDENGGDIVAYRVVK